MSSDDQYFIDVLGGISSDIRKFSANVFDTTDKHLDSAVSAIKGAFTSSSWIPERIKPTPPPQTILHAQASYVERVGDWITRNKAITVAVITLLGTGGFLIYQQKYSHKRRRRAKRAANGARREVVVLVGPASSLHIKSLMGDLERRGFIVYCLVNSEAEEKLVRTEAGSKPDIRPFHLNLDDPIKTQQALERFQNLISSPHHAFDGASSHTLIFSGLILAPDLVYPSGPIETLAAEIWSEELNTKLITAIATARAFLPSVCEFQARVLVLTPNVVSSLQPAFHGLESTIVSALDSFATTLRRELHTLGIKVCQLKLGNFDFHAHGAKHHLPPVGEWRTITWPPSSRLLYAQNFINQARTAAGRGVFGESGSMARGSSPRYLHNAVFDALTEKRPRGVWRVGRGSLAYDIVGKWVPSGLVGWVLGLRRVSLEEMAGPGPQLTLEDSSVLSWEQVDTADNEIPGGES
ncbi:DUF1776-domain-containing protein [Tothia fuscella]|uniref:DUF1776-domain-containing protein n=1 Tax=Tothia fuscella TaxID=1048955 RepID=A0A9P4U442_9PEZI|nr:DUF1776-domain-containing protein [Tothia fuscella]